MTKSKIIRVPREFLIEMKNLKNIEKLKNNAESCRKIVEYARIGKEIAHKDLLTANTIWFGIRKRKKK